MIKRIVKFIHNLRIYFFILILASFLYYLGLNPVDVGRFFGAKIGSAVGMSVGVPENPFNKLALQLKEKEDRLTQKEQELIKREDALDYSGGPQIKLIIFLSAGIIVLFVLVLLNYYFDYKRKKEKPENK